MTLPLTGSDLAKYNNVPTTPTGNKLGDLLNLLWDTDSAVDRVAEPGISGEALMNGCVVTYNNAGGVPRVFKSAAEDVNPLRRYMAGVCVTATTGPEVLVAVVTNGRVAIPDSMWPDGVPTPADVGKWVYNHAQPGCASLTVPPIPPPGHWVQRIGVLRQGGAGACQISVQQGEGYQF